MVRDEGALRFVSMDEEEEKRLEIIKAILHQILSASLSGIIGDSFQHHS